MEEAIVLRATCGFQRTDHHVREDQVCVFCEDLMAFSLYQPQPAAGVHLWRGFSGNVLSSNLNDSCQPMSIFLRLFTARGTKSAWGGDNTSFSVSQFRPRENLGHVGKLKPARLLPLECWGSNLFFFCIY